MPQDFSGQNLRGRSFKGQNLTGADFNNADIRGTDFTGANLTNTCFNNAKAGLQHYSVFIILTLSILLLIVLGFICVIIAAYVDVSITGIVVFVLLSIFAIVTSQKGLETALGIQVIASFSFLILSVTAILIKLVTSALTLDKALRLFSNLTLAETGALTGAMAWILTCAASLSVNLVLAESEVMCKTIPSALAAIGMLCGVIIGTIAVTMAGGDTVASIWAAIGAEVVVLATIYCGWETFAKDEKFTLIHQIALAIAAMAGTSFRGADLTGADFTNTTLKNTDLRNAILTHTLFQKAKLLDHIRPGRTYLHNSKVREVLVSRHGEGKNFDRQDLRGVNFKGAKLQDASFIGADLQQFSGN